MVLEVEIACLLGIHADGFGFVPNCLDLINAVSGSLRVPDRRDEQGHGDQGRPLRVPSNYGWTSGICEVS